MDEGTFPKSISWCLSHMLAQKLLREAVSFHCGAGETAAIKIQSSARKSFAWTSGYAGFTGK